MVEKKNTAKSFVMILGAQSEAPEVLSFVRFRGNALRSWVTTKIKCLSPVHSGKETNQLVEATARQGTGGMGIYHPWGMCN